MEVGMQVRMRYDPGRTGILTGKSRVIAGTSKYQVMFPDGSRSWYPDYELIIVCEDLDEWDLLDKGSFGRVGDLRRNLTRIRLSGRLADLVYSMDTTNTEFFAYQFKPVLRFLDSASNGLLIADEVGLGKTIEAGLIWTELRSRFDARRLVVVCPAMLRDKWRDELRNRFGLDAEILGPKELLADFKQDRHQLLEGRAIICSLQGLRPPLEWEDAAGKEGQSARAKLARFLSERAGDEPLIDLLVVDEAAHLRNPETKQYEIGSMLRDVSEHVVLLSATPINLRSDELFVLLNLIDPDSFHARHVFPAVIEANAPLIKAREAALDRTVTAKDIINLISQATTHPLLRGSSQLAELLSNPPRDSDMMDINYRTGLADRLERLNLLAGVVSRTRKREVQEWRVIRQAHPEFVTMSADESDFYRLVTEAVRDYASMKDIHEGFLLSMPQRQMSSCMVAAAESWCQRTGFDKESIYEEYNYYNNESNDTDEDVGKLIRFISARVLPWININALRAQDSKYACLHEVLVDFLNKNSDEKVVLFSTFRHTLFYLAQRLEADGISCRLLVGGMQEDKQEFIAAFRRSDTERVLLSSEVASEGVDLQFCWVLINYDLPWNPMKVEQRIGRIDRLGQGADTVHIWNLGFKDTIDERIFQRLHQRLGIFEYALGGLEQVLGEQIRKLTSDLMTQKLTREQEEQRIQQTELAIKRIRQETEQLEQQASSLVAYGGYILEQVRAARDFGRIISARDLVLFVRDHLTRFYQGSEMRQVDDDALIFDIKLSIEAANSLAEFIRQRRLRGLTRLVAGESRPIRCQFLNKVSLPTRQGYEQISQFHPLIRFINEDLRRREDSYYPLVAMEITEPNLKFVEPAIYAFVIHLWTLEGMRINEKLMFRVCKLDENHQILDADSSELLVTKATLEGKDWPAAVNEFDLVLTREGLERCHDELEKNFFTYRRQVEAENKDRISFQLESARQTCLRQMGIKAKTLEKHQQKGRTNMIKATQGQIDKLLKLYHMREEELKKKEQLNSHYEQVCMGIIRVSENIK